MDAEVALAGYGPFNYRPLKQLKRKAQKKTPASHAVIKKRCAYISVNDGGETWHRILLKNIFIIF